MMGLSSSSRLSTKQSRFVSGFRTTARICRLLTVSWCCCCFGCCLLLLSGSVVVVAQNQQQRQLVVTLPLHDGSSGSDTAAVGISHAAAVMMALQHAQVGYGGVVEQLAQCPNSNSGNASLSSWNVTFLDSARSTAGLISILGEQGRTVDAMVGGYPTAATFTSDEPSLVQISSQLVKPLILYGGGSERSLLSPMVTRLFPTVTAYGSAIVDFLSTVLNRTDYYGIVVERSSGTALQYMQALLGILSPSGDYLSAGGTNAPPSVENQLFTFQMRGDQTTLFDCFGDVKRSGYRTLLFLLDDEMYPEQLTAMARALASTESPIDRRDYVWVLVGNLDLAYFETAPAEVLEFATGSFLVTPVERFMWVDNETFPTAWNRTASNDNVAALQRLLPTVTIPSDYYTTTPPEAGSGFIYDALASLLLATTCQSGSGASNGGGNGADIATNIQETDFRGASGLVVFDRRLDGSGAVYPGARVDASATFGAYNVMPNGSLPLVATRGAANSSSSSEPGRWKAMPDVTILYSSGTTVPPPLRSETDQNLLTPAARIWGFVLFGILLLFLGFCAAWLFRFRDTQVVRSSQPAFLGLLLLGSLSVSFCIVTSSFDEGAGWSEEQLSRACTATPWLIVCGIQLIYSSIFCKLKRIDKVLQFRRRKVSVGQVVWPMAVIFAIVLVLLTAWTALGGFDWVRTVSDPFTGESSAQCQGDDTSAWFVPILLLMVSVVLLTAFLVYKTRDIDSMYSETSLISAMILFQVQMLLVTIPLLILVSQMDTVTRYIVQIAIYFLLSASSSGFLIVPRIWRYYFPKNDGPKRGSRRGTTVSGVTRPAGSFSVVASTNATRSGSSGDGEAKRGAINSDTSNSGEVFKADLDQSSSHRSLPEHYGDDAAFYGNHNSNGRVSFAVPDDVVPSKGDTKHGSSSATSLTGHKPDEDLRMEL